jgi:uncharacterized membrane protein YqgA involved in biofilm formation
VTGTFLNVATVLVGGTLGWLLGSRFPAGLRRTLMQVVGLATLAIGIQDVLQTSSVLIVLASLVLGAIVGELMRIERALERLGELAQSVVARVVPGLRSYEEPPYSSPPLEGAGTSYPVPVEEAGRTHGGRVRGVPPAQGFVTASLIFCVGPITILGCFEEGLTGTFQTLALKSTLDGFTASLLASTMGWGVMLSAGTILIYQGSLTLGAAFLRGLLSDRMIAEMTAAGGLMILGIGLNILEVTRIRVGNMLPALLFAPVLAAVSAQRGG